MDTVKCVTRMHPTTIKKFEILIKFLQLPFHKINDTKTTQIRLLRAVHYHS